MKTEKNPQPEADGLDEEAQAEQINRALQRQNNVLLITTISLSVLCLILFLLLILNRRKKEPVYRAQESEDSFDFDIDMEEEYHNGEEEKGGEIEK